MICQSLSGTESSHSWAAAVAANEAAATAANAAWLPEPAGLDAGWLRRLPPAVPTALSAVLGVLPWWAPGCEGVEAEPVEGPLKAISAAGRKADRQTSRQAGRQTGGRAASASNRGSPKA